MSSRKTRTYRVEVIPGGALQRGGALVTHALVTIDRQTITVPADGASLHLLAAFREHGLDGAGIGPCNALLVHGKPVGHLTHVHPLAVIPAPRREDEDITALARSVGMTDLETR